MGRILSVVGPAAPLIILAGLYGAASLAPPIPRIDIGPLDPSKFASTLLLFAVLAAVVERAVEVLMMLRFGAGGSVADQKLRAIQAVDALLDDQAASRLAMADTPQERLAILSALASPEDSDQELGARLREIEAGRRVEKRKRSLWAGLCSLTLSLAIALNGFLLLGQLVSSAEPDALGTGTGFSLVDVVVTALLISGGAEWFHRSAKTILEQTSAS